MVFGGAGERHDRRQLRRDAARTRDHNNIVFGDYGFVDYLVNDDALAGRATRSTTPHDIDRVWSIDTAYNLGGNDTITTGVDAYDIVIGGAGNDTITLRREPRPRLRRQRPADVDLGRQPEHDLLGARVLDLHHRDGRVRATTRAATTRSTAARSTTSCSAAAATTSSTASRATTSSSATRARSRARPARPTSRTTRATGSASTSAAR